MVDEGLIEQYTAQDKHPKRRVSSQPLSSKGRAKRESMASLRSQHTAWSGNVSLPHISATGVSIVVSAAVEPKQEDLGYFPYVPPTPPSEDPSLSESITPSDVKAAVAKAKARQAACKARPLILKRPWSSGGGGKTPKAKPPPPVRALTDSNACNIPTDSAPAGKEKSGLFAKQKNLRKLSLGTLENGAPHPISIPVAAVNANRVSLLADQQLHCAERPMTEPEVRGRASSPSRPRTQPYAAPFFLPPPEQSARIKSIHPSRSMTLPPPDKAARKLRSTPQLAML